MERPPDHEQVELPEELILQLTGIATDESPFHRRTVLEAITAALPKDPHANVLMYTAEIRPGAVSAWHLHTGPLFCLVLQGRAIVEFEDEEVEYVAGQAFIEPVGRFHRARNPQASGSTVSVAVQLWSPEVPGTIQAKAPW